LSSITHPILLRLTTLSAACGKEGVEKEIEVHLFVSKK